MCVCVCGCGMVCGCVCVGVWVCVGEKDVREIYKEIGNSIENGPKKVYMCMFCTYSIHNNIVYKCTDLSTPNSY